jgi:thiol-disulfide isomerase/thioredoxin
MTSRTALILMGLVVGTAGTRGDEPTRAKADGRVVEGVVVAAGREPVEGARVFFGQPEQGLSFVEAATATTDARGRYRVDLSKFPWSTGTMRAWLLAPGFQVGDRTVGAGTGATTADFELEAQPWKETRLRLEDAAGRPVEGVEVTCIVGDRTIWARPKTDAEGRCQIAMAPGMPIGLSARPEGARPIRTYLGVMEDEPAAITLPVLPPIRGRVLDPEGRPVPDVAVGRTIDFGPDGRGQMLSLLASDKASTDREGGFVITPEIYASSARDLTASRRSKTQAICFADPGFRRMAYRTFDPTRAVEPMEVTLEPTRRVRVPIVRGSVAAPPQARLSSQISITPFPDLPEQELSLIGRILAQEEQAEGVVVEEYLPEGTYQLGVSLTAPNAFEGLGKARRVLVVPGGEGPLDLPPLELELPDFLKMVDKPAPEIEASDLDTGRPVTLADFRGKVVVLDFWGYWCGPCNVSMPFLMELHRKFEGRPLAIVALHDQSVQARAEYDRKIAVVRRQVWGGRHLPFRVLLDRPDPKTPADVGAEAHGATIKRYGVRAFPTLFVIDPDGTMVAPVPFWDHDRLESLVRDLVEKAEAR